MGDQANESPMMEGPARISDYRYNRAIAEITLLKAIDELTNTEVKRLISQLKSPDYENWTVAEEIIKNKLVF